MYVSDFCRTLAATKKENAEIYVWKGGLPILSAPDSITFVKPEMSAQVQDIEDKGSQDFAIRYLFLTKDYMGKPQWQSALPNLTADQCSSKHIGKMVLYNHYTVMRASTRPNPVHLLRPTVSNTSCNPPIATVPSKKQRRYCI